jgi:microsomal dipeptidase-like Zn-dependent dipeptidase
VIADLHAHYPMHVIAELEPDSTLRRMRHAGGPRRLPDRFRALVLTVAAMIGNDREWWSGWRISAQGLRAGGVGVAFSVLYGPFEEMDLDEPYGAPPREAYFRELVRELELVEQDVAGRDPGEIRVVHARAELDAALAAGATALVHCVEGGFHLGRTAEEVDRNVAELARRGVAYITLAHLFWRRVAANAPAIPFLPDPVYNVLFPQRAGAGLTDLGRAAVRAMARERILIDLSHMRGDAIEQTFALLDEVDPAIPVISSHAGWRFGGQRYMHDEDTVRRIAARGGVIGLILAQHQLNDGVRGKQTRTLEESFEVVRRHVDRIHEITGSHDHVGIGSDFDGFIRPTMGGLETAADLGRLEHALRAHYGDDVAGRITSGNAVRVLRALWP